MPTYKRALVTGGAGFVGGHLCHALAAKDLEVTCVDNLVNGNRKNIPHAARFIEGDVRDKTLMKRLACEADIVFHQAAVGAIRASSDSVYDDAETNIMGTLITLEACKETPVRKFVYASSMAVYGESVVPMTEDYVMEPRSAHGISKLAGERYVHNICRALGIKSVALRYFNTYGIRQALCTDSGVVTIFIKRLLAGQPITIFGNGEQIRDYVSVTDVVKANLLAMKKEISGESFNIASGVTRTVNEVASLLIEELAPGTKPLYEPAQPGETFRSEPNMTKAKSVLCYKPKSDLGKDLREIIEWHRLNPDG